jgi:hypothetical protein
VVAWLPKVPDQTESSTASGSDDLTEPDTVRFAG